MVNRVERLVLDAGTGVKFCKRQNGLQFLPHGGSAAIAVSNGIPDRGTIGIQKQKVNSPGINTDRCGRIACIVGGFQPLDHILNQAFHIPAKVTVLFNQAVFKAVDFMQGHNTMLHGANNVPAAGCSDIYSKITGLHLSLLLVKCESGELPYAISIAA